MQKSVLAGFLAHHGTFRATVPSELTDSREACSVIVVGQAVKSVQWADDATVASMMRDAELYEVGRRDEAGTAVHLYGQNAPHSSHRENTVLMFRPNSHQTGHGAAWITLEDGVDGIEMRDALLRHIKPFVDRHGVMRIRVDGPIRHGSPLDPAQREMVAFYGPRRPYDVQAVVFTNTGAFGSDRDNAAAGAASAVRTTSHGVSVTCNGGPDMQAELRRRAREVADSLRPA